MMRLNKKIVALFVLMVGSVLAQAHEFWMHPSGFFFSKGESVVISFKVGENFTGEPWNLQKSKLLKLEHHRMALSKDLFPITVEGEKEHLRVLLEEEGTHLFVMQTNHAFVDLEAEKFNEYLKEDGLDDAYNRRKKTNSLDKNGREMYARYTKLFVQAGKKKDDTYKKEIGLPLEIMPIQNPYQLKVGSRVSFKILFKGKPLFGARVKVWNRHNNRTMVQNIYSQQDGVIETHISNPGMWMVSVVNMIPAQHPKADWESFWGSMVFGVQ
jgi:uncharacterized GH25 family protein